ncbi:hypothetical protein [Thiothrix nivea]|uniref:HPt domain-containing protein n=1 Tax=Thiothrix nivea (strain ATCC 35100 / DSM 5205 / JP2) TaxID=870187 RepID=A0A656HHM5_THINJ|nr:hypothetical protein [Thiothrix nivea]EIJ35534.1 hypothetical protein Thini_3008 [Thiothrix nivea DSM 5205]
MTAPSALHTLAESLGVVGARRFLVAAQPLIHQARHDLLACLREQDWKAAAAIAHRLKATAHLYGSPTLQDYITAILAKDSSQLQQQVFQNGLEAEFQHVENAIAIWLNNK